MAQDFSSDRFFAYIVLLKNLTYLSFLWVLVFYISFSFFSQEYGGLISSLSFLSSAIVRVLFSKIIAHKINRYSGKNKIKISIFARTALVLFFVLSLFFLPQKEVSSVSLLVVLYLFSLLLLVDNYATFDIKYRFDTDGLITLNKYTSLSNIGNRGSIAISSMIALSLLGNWYDIAIVMTGLSLLGMLSSILYYMLFGQDETSLYDSGATDLDSKQHKINNNLYQYCLGFNWIMNLCLGSVAIIVANVVSTYDIQAVFNVNFLAILYSGLVVYLIASVLHDKKVNRYYSPVNILITSTILCFLLILFSVALPSFVIASLIIFLAGLFYGGSLTGMSVLSLQTIRGPDSSIYFSKIDSYGRLAFLISGFVAGLLIDLGVDTVLILQIFSVLAIVAIVFIYYFFIAKARGKYATKRCI